MLTLGRVFGFKRGQVSHPERTLERFGLPPGTNPLRALAARPETIFVKTHRLARAGDATPAIYLVRDGRDSLISHAHYVGGRNMPGFAGLDFEARLEKIIEEGPARQRKGTWSDHVRSWTSRPGPTAIVHFEELIQDPVSAIGGAMQTLGVTPPRPQKEIPTFEELRERDPVMFHRGKVGAWKAEMPAELEQLFWSRHGPEMEALGYSRGQENGTAMSPAAPAE